MPRPDEGMIHAWLDGELSAEEAERVARLVATDPEWEAAAAEARGLIAASSRIVSALDVVPAGVIPSGSRAAPAKKSRFTVRPWLRMAAGFVLVAGTASAVWTRTANTPAPGEMASRAMMADASVAEAPAAPSVTEQESVNPPVAAGASRVAEGSLERQVEPARDAVGGARQNAAGMASAGAGVAAAKRTPAEAEPIEMAAAGTRLRQETAKTASAETRLAPGDAPPPSAAAARLSNARADLSETMPAVLAGCWRAQVAGRADTVLADPRIVRQAGDTLTLVVAADGRTAVVRRDGADRVRGETRIGRAAPEALLGTRVECPVSRSP